MGLIGGILQPLYVGRPNVLMSPMTFLQKPVPLAFGDHAVSRHRPAAGPISPTICASARSRRSSARTLDLSSWQVAFNGAEPVRAETLERVHRGLRPCGFRREAFYPCYGLAEATLIVSGGYVEQPPVIRSFDADALADRRGGRRRDRRPRRGAGLLVGAARNCPTSRSSIVDPETTARAARRAIGEIWVSGPSVAQGYWQQPEATEQDFPGPAEAIPATGPFLRTGDLGFLQDGELFVTGRLKDLIIVRGVNHYPAGHRADRGAEPSAAAARLRRGLLRSSSDGREQLVVVQEIERHKRPTSAECLTPFAGRWPREHELPVDAIVLVKAGQHSQDFQRQDPAARLPRGYLAGTLDVVGRVATPRRSVERQVGSRAPGRGRGRPLRTERTRRRARASRRSAARRARGRCGNRAGSQRRRQQPVRASTAGDGKTRSVAELVLEEIRRVAKERADGMTLDSPIVETGAGFAGADGDSGLAGRAFWRPVSRRCAAASWRPAATWSPAVEKYLGQQPRRSRAIADKRRHSAGGLSLRPVPGVSCKLRAESRHARGLGLGQSVLHGPRGA